MNGAEQFWLRDWLKCGLCGRKVVPRFLHGTRYYACYWVTSSQKQIEGSNEQQNDLLAARRELEEKISKNEEELAHHLQLREDEESFNQFKKSKLGILQDLYKKLMELPNESKRRLITGSLRELIKITPPERGDKIESDNFLALSGWVICQFFYNPMIIQDIFQVDNSSNGSCNTR